MATVITIPQTDPALLAFSLNFSTKIIQSPLMFNLTVLEANSYQGLHNEFAIKLAACDRAVRNKPAVVAKNFTRTALKKQLTLLALRVQSGPAVTDAQKVELGLTIPSARHPVPDPSSAPAIDILWVRGRTVKIRLHNDDVLRRAKPAGVTGAAVFSYVGATPPTASSAYRFEGNTTVTAFEVEFPDTVTAGATVWFTAFWFNERAQSGPGSTAISATIQYGLSQSAGLKIAA